MSGIELFSRIRAHQSAVALDCGEESVRYDQLLAYAETLALRLLETLSPHLADGELEGKSDLREARIGFLLPAGASYVCVQWGIWLSGGIALPLSRSAALPELAHALRDARASCLITHCESGQLGQELAGQLELPVYFVEEMLPELHEATPLKDLPLSTALPKLAPDRRAMILYTSGTTSQPKGVVSTHANIQAQMESLVEAWQWSAADRIPLFLPLHHIHGIINVLGCALWVGARVDVMERFVVADILTRVVQGKYSLFMAVPTIYVKLIAALNALSDTELAPVVAGFRNMRLMISGSAALPASVHHQWTALTGQKLLERYGMTEIGMALSNPYQGERRPGAVGHALPRVQVRLTAESGDVIDGENAAGEIQVRGPTVFLEYWDQPQATAAAFEEDPLGQASWFRTGDVALREDGYYRILGRKSIDIIKSGGYKLSALEIEAILLDHPLIQECAVIGMDDETWGESVAAAVVLMPDSSLELDDLREWCQSRLSKYKIPKQLRVVTQLPRNAMGKVTKPELTDFFATSGDR